MDSQFGVTIVALPSEDDLVRKLSSEKEPHMTLLFLGESPLPPEKLADVFGFVQHAASMLSPFGMSVDYRGELGDKHADVLFFSKSYNYEKLMNFRSNLLTNRNIYEAYHSTEQYPEWTPHLTLGYPETPANEIDRDYGVTWVNFDRIALWTEDSDGPTFRLNNDDLEVMMSTADRGAEFLEHYGVKGMKWGKRKSRQTESDSADSTRTATIKSRAKTQKTTKVFSNEELEAAIKRMRLEQEFSKLSGGIDKTRTQKAKSFVAKLLIDTGKQNVSQVAQSESKRFIDDRLKAARM
jgi:2'-5' RNA ligase